MWVKKFHKSIISDPSFNYFCKGLDLPYYENCLLCRGRRLGAAKHLVLLARGYCISKLVFMENHARVKRKTFIQSLLFEILLVKAWFPEIIYHRSYCQKILHIVMMVLAPLIKFLSEISLVERAVLCVTLKLL